MIELKRVLVPIDFGDTSGAALRYGIEFARRFTARLYLLHVVENPGDAAETEHPIYLVEPMQQHACDRLRALLTRQQLRELQPECAVRFGAAFDEIVAYAEDHDVDLIVMGTHGREGVAHVLLGSVAERVVRRAPCPVMTVHRREHEFVAEDEPIRPSVDATT